MNGMRQVSPAPVLPNSVLGRNRLITRLGSPRRTTTACSVSGTTMMVDISASTTAPSAMTAVRCVSQSERSITGLL